MLKKTAKTSAKTGSAKTSARTGSSKVGAAKAGSAKSNSLKSAAGKAGSGKSSSARTAAKPPVKTAAKAPAKTPPKAAAPALLTARAAAPAGAPDPVVTGSLVTAMLPTPQKRAEAGLAPQLATPGDKAIADRAFADLASLTVPLPTLRPAESEAVTGGMPVPSLAAPSRGSEVPVGRFGTLATRWEDGAARRRVNRPDAAVIFLRADRDRPCGAALDRYSAPAFAGD